MFQNDLARLVLAMAEGDGGGSGGSGADNATGGQGSASGDGGQGGSGDGGDRGGAGGGTGTGGSGSGSSAAPGGNGSQNGTDGRSVESLPKWAQDHIRQLRGEAADNRTGKRDAEQQMTDLQRKVAEAFGIDVGGDGKPDPDKLAADLSRAQDLARQREVELAVHRVAADRSADPLALLDSRSFLDSVADLDPGAGDFQTRLGDKIAEATQNNPRLGAGGSTTAGGRPGGGIGQGGRGPQSGPTGVAAGRALHPTSGQRHNAATT